MWTKEPRASADPEPRPKGPMQGRWAREGEGRRARLQGRVNGTPRPPPLRIFISCGFPQPPTSVHFVVSSTEAIIRVTPRLPVSGWWSLFAGLPRPLA